MNLGQCNVIATFFVDVPSSFKDLDSGGVINFFKFLTDCFTLSTTPFMFVRVTFAWDMMVIVMKFACTYQFITFKISLTKLISFSPFFPLVLQKHLITNCNGWCIFRSTLMFAM